MTEKKWIRPVRGAGVAEKSNAREGTNAFDGVIARSAGAPGRGPSSTTQFPELEEVKK